jgi:hypothetical protein
MEIDDVFERELYKTLEEFAQTYNSHPGRREETDNTVTDVLRLAVPCPDLREKFMEHYGRLTAAA